MPDVRFQIMGVIDFLKDLVSIPSFSGEEEKVAARVREEFEKLDYDEIIEIGGNVCGRVGAGNTVLLYDAHMDVVEPGKGWKEDPFTVRIENEYLYGRGACDDKGSLSAIVYGGAKAKVEDICLFVLGSIREEIAEGNGLRDFLNSTGIKPDFVVIGEPSSLRVARGNRGRLGVRIDIKGEAGHASNPSAGENAIYKSTGVVQNIKKLNDDLKEDSVAVTKIETPNKNINIIPESCSIYCDYRSGVGREESVILEKIKSCAGEDNDVLRITPYYKPWQMDTGHRLIQAADRCLKEKIGESEIIMWNFCTNGSYTAGEAGIPTVGFGPGVEEEAHSAEEKIEIDSVKKAVEFFSALPEYISNAIN